MMSAALPSTFLFVSSLLRASLGRDERRADNRRGRLPTLGGKIALRLRGSGKHKRPSNHNANSLDQCDGDQRPACPPAPAATAISPSAPFSIALRAKRSCDDVVSVIPPHECTASLRLGPRAQRGDDDRHLPFRARSRTCSIRLI